ncbi:MAG: hypothetical protein ACLGIM_09650, partial [Alphaproteobacteria bacterium]
MTNHPPLPDSTLSDSMTAIGYARLEGHDTIARLRADAADWHAFAASWNDLGPDLYMADGGRYRRRRHAVLLCD